MTKLLDLPETSYVLPGNRACAGCGIGIGLRQITAALDGKAVMAVPASCLTVFGGMYPTSSVAVPHSLVVRLRRSREPQRGLPVVPPGRLPEGRGEHGVG